MTAHPPTGAAPPPLDPRALFLGALLGEKPHPDAVLRVAVNRPPASGDGPGTWHEVAAASLEAACAFLTRHEDDGDTYFSPAWMVGGKLKENVVGKRTLSLEVDWKSMPASTPEERRSQARRLLGSTPCPHFAVESGHGVHGHLHLSEGHRVEDYDDPEDGRRHVEILGRAWRLWLEGMARELFGAHVKLDRCHGVERVWRPPGGWNTKVSEGARLLTSDRTRWKPVTLLHPGKPEGIPHVAEADQSFLIPYVGAAEAEQDEADARKNGKHQASDDATDDAAPFDLELLPASIRQRWPLRGMNPSKADYLVAIELARAGQSEEAAKAAIRARRAAAGHDQGKAERTHYIDGTVANAFSEAGRTTSSPPGKQRPAPPPPPREPFPLAALPRAIRLYVEEAAACVGCCVSMVALPLLVVLGAAIGTTRRLKLRGGARPWTEPPILWGALVADSGKQKSPALDQAIDLLRPYEAKAAEENEEARQRHAQELERYQREASRFRTGKEEGEPPERPKRPRYRRHVVSDITIEALLDRLADNPRGVSVVRDELSAWLQSFDAYRAGGRGGDASKWIELHKGRATTVDRKGGDQPTLHLTIAAVSVVGGIQPKTLARHLTPEYFENGLAARLLLTMPPAARRRWTEDEVSAEALGAAERVLERLLALDFEPGEKPVPVDLEFTPDAKAMWISFFDDHADEGECLSGRLAAAWSKGEAYAARLGLLVRLVREAAGESVVAGRVDRIDIEAGITLARWFLGETERVYAVLGESNEQQERRRLADWIRARGGEVTVRDLARGLRAYRNNEAAARQALDALVSAGWGTWEDVRPSARGGRPTRHFVLRTQPGVAEPTEPTSEAGRTPPSSSAGDEEVTWNV